MLAEAAGVPGCVVRALSVRSTKLAELLPPSKRAASAGCVGSDAGEICLVFFGIKYAVDWVAAGLENAG